MRVRGEVAAVCVQMADDAESWREAYRDWTRARARRDRDVRRAQQLVATATGGLDQDRWQAAIGRRRFRTIEDAKLKAKALRSRRAVEAALAELDRTVSDRDAQVAAAAVRLAELSRRIMRLGNLAAVMTGTPMAELRRLTRLASCGTGPGSTGMTRPR